MYKLILVVLAVIAVASAQYLSAPYTYGAGIYRSALGTTYGYPYTSHGAYASPYYHQGYLYK